MDALISRANALHPPSKKRRSSLAPTAARKPPHSRTRPKNTTTPAQDEAQHDATAASIAPRTALPSSLRPPPPSQKSKLKEKEKDAHAHIPDRKLRAQLNTTRALAAARAAQVADAAALLPAAAPGQLAVEDALERTWRVTQHELVADEAVGRDAAAGRRELVLEGGGFKVRWTRNGRHAVLVGRGGSVASVDWATGAVHAEVQLRETCRDATYLHSHHHVAVAQARHAFIYDQNLVELHRLSALIEPAFLEFLPYHWLLVCAGLPGTLSYLDTSMGTIVAQHRPKLGAPTALAQNAHNAVVYWGAGNGTVSLWTPSSPTPHVRLLAHLGPVTALSVDPSSGGRYLATGGQDGRVKVWDARNYSTPVRAWTPRAGPASALEWSQRGVLAVAAGGSVNLYAAPTIHTPHAAPAPPPLYMTHPLPAGARPAAAVRFEPFQDVLAIGHAKGISSILVPGAGEPNFDSAEADPFENRKRRAEREVRSLLDKIQPDMITLDPDVIGALAPPSKLTYTAPTEADGKRVEGAVPFRALPRLERLRAQGKADETEISRDDDEDEDDEEEGDAAGEKKAPREEREKMKMRGKGKALKRYLRKKRKNVVEPSAIAIRAKLEKQRQERKRARAVERGEAVEAAKPSALDRFRRRE